MDGVGATPVQKVIYIGARNDQVPTLATPGPEEVGGGECASLPSFESLQQVTPNLVVKAEGREGAGLPTYGAVTVASVSEAGVQTPKFAGTQQAGLVNQVQVQPQQIVLGKGCLVASSQAQGAQMVLVREVGGKVERRSISEADLAMLRGLKVVTPSENQQQQHVLLNKGRVFVHQAAGPAPVNGGVSQGVVVTMATPGAAAAAAPCHGRRQGGGGGHASRGKVGKGGLQLVAPAGSGMKIIATNGPSQSSVTGKSRTNSESRRIHFLCVTIPIFFPSSCPQSSF
jgi:hypothetical protein